MTNREIFKKYVTVGGDRFICSPQIGAGAGFDARLAGKTWLSDTTIIDTVNACERFDMVPLYNQGLPDLTQLVDGIYYNNKTNYDKATNRRTTDIEFVTPKGRLNSTLIEDELKGGAMIKGLVTDEEELYILEYYLDALLEVDDFSAITHGVSEIRRTLGEDRSLDIQWAMQPYELLCFPDTMNTAIFAMECPHRCRGIMDRILRLNEKLLPAVAKGGADFVFLGGPGSEMISPRFYEDYLVPYSKIITDLAHNNGLLVYTHICSPIEPMLTMGYYNQMGIDLFETLSMPPVGNVKSIEEAFSKLDEEICTRGNIGLDDLLNCEPNEIKEKSLQILQTAKQMGRKHILAASDYMFYGTKTENVQAMCQAVAEFNGTE